MLVYLVRHVSQLQRLGSKFITTEVESHSPVVLESTGNAAVTANLSLGETTHGCAKNREVELPQQLPFLSSHDVNSRDVSPGGHA